MAKNKQKKITDKKAKKFFLEYYDIFVELVRDVSSSILSFDMFVLTIYQM